MSDRSLPENIEAERMVLGAVLLDATLLDEVYLEPSDFYREAHANLWRLMKAMRADGDLLSLTTLLPRMNRDPDRYGGLAYVAGLSDDVPSTEATPAYANVVRECRRKRDIILMLQNVLGRAYNTDQDADDLVAEADRLVHAATATAESAWVSQEQDMEEAHAIATAPPESRVDATPTGYHALDALSGGLRHGELVLIAGRPGSGKSTLADNIATRVAETGVPVGILSLEMKRQSLALRRLSAEARVDGMRLQSGTTTETERARLRHAKKRLARLPLFVDDEGGLTVDRIRQKARRLLKDQPSLAVLIIDYFGLIRGGRGEKRYEQASENAKALQQLAKELNVTLVVLSQLGRQVEQRADRRPLLSDLRETGALEEAADQVLFCYRDEYYDRSAKAKGLMEIIVAKNRSGSVGTAYVHFHGCYTRIDNLDTL